MIPQKDLLKAKILIIDDEPANVTLVERMLKKNGFHNLRSTTDSREAVAIYKECAPDLVLLDLAMPYIDGFQIMEELNKIAGNSYVPVLVLTAQSDPRTRLRALSSGAKDFLAKPLDLLEAVMRISNMLTIRLMHNQLRDRNKILEEKVKERASEIHDTCQEVILRLGRAAEYRDNETSMHIIRMSRFCERLGREAGMNESECRLLLDASPMHDIGKIAIPDRILLKPGKLDAEEWEIMKMHATIGASMLGGSDHELLQLAETIAFTHHEKWDGSGYPRGLQGVKIPFVGQIVAICDVFDALTNERPYKKAWPMEEAVQYVQDQSDKHFNPHLVELFTGILPDLLKIKEQYSDAAYPEVKKLDQLMSA